jgi:polar amino acid transport system substrate-binding protein
MAWCERPARRAVVATLLAWSASAHVAAGAEPRVLTLATGARTPMVSVPGRPGFVEELMRAACRRIGIDLVVLPMPHERALINADTGVEDGDLYRAPGFEQDYPNLVQVPEPLLLQDFVALTMRADLVVRGWDDLRPLAVAYVTGNKIIERHLAGHPQVTTVRDNALAIGLLAGGRADVVIINRWVGLIAAREAGLAARALEPPLLRVPMHAYLHRRHAALAAPLAQALVELRRDGTRQQLYDRTLGALERGR